MTGDQRPRLPRRVVGVNLPSEAYTTRYVGRAQVPDHHYRTDVASVRILLNGLRKWQPNNTETGK
jgi:hypothetical protein